MNKDEQILRENIRHLIKHVKQKKQNEESQIKESYNNPEILKNYPAPFRLYQQNKELFKEAEV